MMLTGIKAFEARWNDLKSTYPTTPQQKHMLMQAMGRLVDNYATQSEIAAELPVALQAIFTKLVDAYLNGYWKDNEAALPPQQTAPTTTQLSPALAAAAERRKKAPTTPNAASEAPTYIIHDRVAFLEPQPVVFSA